MRCFSEIPATCHVENAQRYDNVVDKAAVFLSLETFCPTAIFVVLLHHEQMNLSKFRLLVVVVHKKSFLLRGIFCAFQEGIPYLCLILYKHLCPKKRKFNGKRSGQVGG